MIAALLFLLAFSQMDLVEETVEIPAHDWRWVDRALAREPAMVDCVFQSDGRDARVRMVLLDRTDLNLWRVGRDHDEIAATPVGAHGTLRESVHDPDAYVAVENRGSQPAHVHLRVFLENPRVRYLSRGRRIAVICISFGVFFAIVSFSAKKLLKAIKG